jgi:hypothetical protein
MITPRWAPAPVPAFCRERPGGVCGARAHAATLQALVAIKRIALLPARLRLSSAWCTLRAFCWRRRVTRSEADRTECRVPASPPRQLRAWASWTSSRGTGRWWLRQHPGQTACLPAQRAGHPTGMLMKGVTTQTGTAATATAGVRRRARALGHATGKGITAAATGTNIGIGMAGGAAAAAAGAAAVAAAFRTATAAEAAATSRTATGTTIAAAAATANIGATESAATAAASTASAVGPARMLPGTQSGGDT